MLHQYADFQKSINLLNKQETLESRSQPFFFIFWVVAALFIAEAVYDGYKSNQDHSAMSSLLADAANGKVVPFGQDAVMRCQVREVMK